MSTTLPSQTPPPVAPPAAPPAPVPYHRMALAGPRPRWWRPALTVLLTGVFGVLIMVVGIVAAVLLGVDLEGSMRQPGTAAFQFGLIAALLPAALAAVWVAEGRRPGTLSSVAGRLRWGLLVRYLALAAGLWVFVNVISGGVLHLGDARWTSTSLSLLLVALLVIPFQAAAEEYLFRALPQQVLGSWLRNPWWGILLPVPVFAVLHVYNLPGLTDVALFAVVAGILTWRTGGLEAAIGLHVVNNAAIMVAGAFGMGDLDATEVGWFSAAMSVLCTVVYAAIVLRWNARTSSRAGLTRSEHPSPLADSPQQ